VSFHLLIAFLMQASITDIWKKKIPNALVVSIIILGLLNNYYSNGIDGLYTGILGFLTGLLLMLPFYIFFSMGGGDVKLIAAVGASTGTLAVIYIILYTMVAAFFMALIYLGFKGNIGSLLIRLWVTICGALIGVKSYQLPEAGDAALTKMPYAPAILIATFIVVYDVNLEATLLTVKTLFYDYF